MDQYYNDLKNKYNQETQSFQNNAQQLVDQQAQNVQKLNQSYKGTMASSITGGDAYSIPTAPAGVTITPPITVSPTPTTPSTPTTPTTFYTNIPTTPTTETTPTTTTPTTTPTQADMDAMKDLYPSIQYPSDINPVQTPTTTPTATVPAGSSVEDYVNYYKSLGVTTPDKSYDEWVAWKNGTGTPTTTTPSQPTSTPTQTEPTTVTPTPSPAAGLTVSDYINYYKNLGVTTPDKSYDEWYSWMQSGGPDSSASTPTTGTPTTGTPTTGDTQAAADIVAEWNALIAKYQAGTLTLEEARRLEELAGIMNSSNPSSTPTPTTGDNTSSPTTTTPTSGDNTSSPSTTIPSANDPGYDPYLAYWVQTHPGADYSALYYAKYGVYPSNTGTPGNGNPGTNTTENPGYDPYLAAWAQQTGADYNLLYFAKYGVYPSDSGTPGTSGSGNTDAAGHGYPTVQMDNIQKIKDMYDAQIEAQKLALQEQGDQALSDAQANKDKIAGLYNQQRNAASVDWERQRRNFLEGAATSGLNTGSGSQAELAMMSEYQRTQNNLGAAQAQAETEAERNIADIRRSTQASINEAIAKNDYQKAAALLDEYNAEYNRAVARAEALGQYGDFSGYAAIYGQEAANQMQRTWVMSNPEIALAMGLITQSQYATLTLYKQYPALAMAAGNAGSSGSSGDYSGSGTNDNYKDTLDYLTKHYLEITSKVAEHYNPNP